LHLVRGRPIQPFVLEKFTAPKGKKVGYHGNCMSQPPEIAAMMTWAAARMAGQ
jgi:hypothetical protein